MGGYPVQGSVILMLQRRSAYRWDCGQERVRLSWAALCHAYVIVTCNGTWFCAPSNPFLKSWTTLPIYTSRIRQWDCHGFCHLWKTSIASCCLGRDDRSRHAIRREQLRTSWSGPQPGDRMIGLYQIPWSMAHATPYVCLDRATPDLGADPLDANATL